MKTVTDIIEVLPSLTTKELQGIERQLIEIYRQRKQGIIFDDAYGVLTEEEHMAAIGETWATLDGAEKIRAKRKK
jgi:hypothetical protein